MCVVGMALYSFAADLINPVVILCILMATLGATLVLGRTVVIDILRPRQHTLQTIQLLAEGSYQQVLISTQTNLEHNVAILLHTIAQNMQAATHFAQQIGEGKYETSFTGAHANDELSLALVDMRDKLKRMAEEEQKRNWTINGVAKFSEFLRNHQSTSIADITFRYIQQLVKYLGANQGGVYLVNEEEKEDVFIELTACYAYEKKKYKEKRIEIKQGLVGQCLYENEFIYLTEIPENYLRITSGLGDAAPRYLLLVPIKTHEQTLGVIEIASFYPIHSYQVQLVESVSEGLASVLTNVRVNTHTQKLLADSRAIAEELRRKEEILHQSTEELMATQEELRLKMVEIEKESALTTSIVDAINKTNAALELDMNGTIIDVNDMYLSLMEYQREEVIGKSERAFVSADDLSSDRYEMMWASLQTGAFNSGEYRRMSKSGRELWLTGTYSPIYDIDGKPYKIIQYSQFTTEQKEKELELISKINSINQAVSLIEININGSITVANTFFMQEFGYKRGELKNMQLSNLLDPLYDQLAEFTDVWETVCKGVVCNKILGLRTKKDVAKSYICNFSPSRNLAGQISKVLLLLIDVTERKLLQEKLKELLLEEKRKNAILEMQAETTDEFVDDLAEIMFQLEETEDWLTIDNFLRDKKIPLLQVKTSGKITLTNQSALNILGLQGRNLIDTEVADLLTFKNQEERRHFEDKIKTPKVVQLKITFVMKMGQFLTFNVFMIPRFTQKPHAFDMLMLLMNVEPIPTDIQ